MLKFKYELVLVKKKNINYFLLQNDLFDFEESLKQFGSFVPSLTHLNLYIQRDSLLQIQKLKLNLFNSTAGFNILKCYYKRLKSFIIGTYHL